jgi:hypothetical protein
MSLSVPTINTIKKGSDVDNALIEARVLYLKSSQNLARRCGKDTTESLYICKISGCGPEVPVLNIVIGKTHLA